MNPYVLTSIFVLAELFALPAIAAETPAISVGQNVQVSSALPSLPHYEVILAADPSDASRLLGCSNYAPVRPSATNLETVCYLSTDGGSRWSPVIQTANADSGDPAVAFGLNGLAYYADLREVTEADGHQRGHTFLWTSRDGGKTWSEPQMLRQGDREFIAVDTTGGKLNGRVYVNEAMVTRSIDDDPAHRVNFVNGFGVFVSDDGKTPFHFQNLLDPADNHYVFADGNSIVMPDGTYGVVFPDEVNRHSPPGPGEPNFAIKFISSSDGGSVFQKSVTIATAEIPMSATAIGVPPMIAVDNSNGPFRNRLYVVWTQLSGAQSQVMMAHSVNNGKTWVAPMVVEDAHALFDGKGPVNREPIVAVNTNGVVGVSWYDRRESSDQIGSYERFSASLDGGETFLPSVRVSASPSAFYNAQTTTLDGAVSTGGGDRTEDSQGDVLKASIGYNGFGFIGGHTEGLAADASGVFHTLWVDNRTGVMQVWTAPVSVVGAVVVNGSPQLAAMRDVTNLVTIDTANARFDRASGIVSIDAYLANTSDKPIRGPLKVRLTTLTSKMGDVRLLTSDNDFQTRGAVLDYSSLVPAGGLAPGQRSRPKHLRFHLSNLRPQAAINADSLASFVDFTSHVYGGT